MLIVDDQEDDLEDDEFDEFITIDLGYNFDKKREKAEEFNSNGGNIIIITHSEFFEKYLRNSQ
jgi:ABC-type uncharacterized transport system substrate-binding protein